MSLLSCRVLSIADIRDLMTDPMKSVVTILQQGVFLRQQRAFPDCHTVLVTETDLKV